MRPPVDHIAAPRFPPGMPWINAEELEMGQPLARPMLVEFWDFCRVNSIRTLPYVKGWHDRYAHDGLRVIGVHTPGFEPSRDPDAVRAAVARLEVRHPVVVDTEHEIWHRYGNLGWPARYLFDEQGLLADYHYGEGAYDETERAIQGLLGLDGAILPVLRREDQPDARLGVHSEDVTGPYCGPYQAGGVWAVLDGRGSVTANGQVISVEHPGCYPLISHPRSTRGELVLELGPEVQCHAVCFTPGLAG